MQNTDSNEMNFIFKVNKITHLLNHVDIYYQKEILQDIKRYNNKMNITLNNQKLNENEKKRILYNYLNKYLDNIINDQLDYLLDAYHKNNKEKIMIDSEKKAYRSINMNNIDKNIDNSVNNKGMNMGDKWHTDSHYVGGKRLDKGFTYIVVTLFDEFSYQKTVDEWDKTLNDLIDNKDNIKRWDFQKVG